MRGTAYVLYLASLVLGVYWLFGREVTKAVAYEGAILFALWAAVAVLLADEE